MATQQKLPDLADKVQREHEALEERLDEIREALHGESGEPLARVLEEFYREVEDHFRGEEDEAVFDEAVSFAPRLSERAAALLRQHPPLLEAAEDLVAMAHDGHEPWEIAARFELFAKKWMHHETEENRLLQEAYNEDLGESD